VLFQLGFCPYRANLWSFDGMGNRDLITKIITIQKAKFS